MILKLDDEGMGVAGVTDLPLVATSLQHAMAPITAYTSDFTAGALPLEVASALPDVRDVALSVRDLP